MSTPHTVQQQKESAPTVTNGDAAVQTITLSKFAELAQMAKIELRVVMDERWTSPDVIALEGLIGVGKSTLAQQVKAKYGVKVLAEETPDALLRAFYADKQSYGFTLQMVMAGKRLHQAQLLTMRTYEGEPGAFEKLPNGAPLSSNQIWDRSILGDFMFAWANYLIGNMSFADFAIYYETITGFQLTTLSETINMVDALPIFRPSPKFNPKTAPKTFVFLVDEFAKCAERVKQRGKKHEQDIPLSYYELLDDVHFAVLLHLLCNKERLMGPDGHIFVMLHDEVRDNPERFMQRLLVERPNAKEEACTLQVSKYPVRQADVVHRYIGGGGTPRGFGKGAVPPPSDEKGKELLDADHPDSDAIVCKASEVKDMMDSIPDESRGRNVQAYLSPRKDMPAYLATAPNRPFKTLAEYQLRGFTPYSIANKMEVYRLLNKKQRVTIVPTYIEPTRHRIEKVVPVAAVDGNVVLENIGDPSAASASAEEIVHGELATTDGEDGDFVTLGAAQ